MLLLLIPLAALLSGCGSDGRDGGADMKYLRTPDPDGDKKKVVEDRVSLLFPTGKDRVWQVAVHAMGTNTQETVRVDVPHTVGKLKDATTLTMYQNNKPYRSEMFLVKPDALSLAAAGGADKMVMSPPMVLLRNDSAEGAEYKWEGEITFKGAKAPAQAYSRVYAPREVDTPAGKFKAYRVDTSLTTIIEGHAVTFPASRWFAPGVGIVRQTFRVGNASVEKELVSYKGG